jgi:ferredoxin-NADP reductase
MAAEREARLTRIAEHTPDTRSLFLAQQGERLVYHPGQFLSCLLPVGGEMIIRPYSLASDPEDGELEICLNRVENGLGSNYLLGLEVGATLRYTGPWGTFTLERAPDVETVFIAEGTAIAPIRPMLHRALATGARHPLSLLYAADSSARLLYRSELETLAKAHPIFRFEPQTSGTLADEVERRFVARDGNRHRRFFICGVGTIVPTLRDLLRRAGYERRAVQYEKW